VKRMRCDKTQATDADHSDGVTCGLRYYDV